MSIKQLHRIRTNKTKQVHMNLLPPVDYFFTGYEWFHACNLIMSIYTLHNSILISSARGWASTLLARKHDIYTLVSFQTVYKSIKYFRILAYTQHALYTS